jgi:hypothetical protein
VRDEGGMLGAKVGEPVTESIRGGGITVCVVTLPLRGLGARGRGSSSKIEKPFEVDMRGTDANFDVSDGSSAVARGLHSAWMTPCGSCGIRIRRSDGKALSLILAARREVARQQIGSELVKGKDGDSGRCIVEGDVNAGNGLASK